LQPLQGTQAEIAEMQRVLAGAPTYFELTTGHPPGAAEGQDLFTSLPPGLDYQDKFVWAIRHDDRSVGCIETVKGWPGPGTAIIGLFLLQESSTGLGIGGQAYRLLEAFTSQTALALERGELAREAEHARVRAETEQMRSALLSSVSHDLRTPLAAITGAATSLLDESGALPAPTRRELMETIADEAGRLNRLVSNLLQMTRLEAGVMSLQRGWHSLEEVIGAALQRVAPLLERRPVATHVPPDLPLVLLDDVLIEQVVFNLLENATKYAPPGAAIDVSARRAGDTLEVEVADRGPGLPAGEEEQVFVKFHRAGGGRAEGVGLGLAICKGIVEAHGGGIRAANRAGGGAAFTFTLPLEGTPPTVEPESGA